MKLKFLLSTLLGITAMLHAAEPATTSQPSTAATLKARLTYLTGAFYSLQKDVDEFLNETPNRSESAASQATLQKQLNSLYFELVSVQEQLAALEQPESVETLVAGRNGTYLPENPPPSLDGESPLPGSSLNLQSITSAAPNDLKISGFMDAIYEAHSDRSTQNDAHINQVEVDLSHDINPKANAFLGIWYADGFQIGYALMTYKPYVASNESATFKSWTVGGGQFDAPFGEDVSNYSSNIRKTVTAPDIVKLTHGMWNNIGAQSNLKLSILSFDVYTMRGFGLQASPAGSQIEYTANVTAGTRLNCHCSSSLKIGSSYAHGWMTNGQAAMTMYGAHATFSPASWSFIAEALALNEDESGLPYTTQGLYLQAAKQVGRFFGVTRADYSDVDSHNPVRHLSCGAGVNLGSGLEARTEYQIDGAHDDHQAFAQLVATF